VSARIGAPAALLQRVRGRWRFVADSGDGSARQAAGEVPAAMDPAPGSVEPHWTGIPLDPHTDWMLLVPGRKDEWQGRDEISAHRDDFGRAVADMTREQRAASVARADRIAYVLGRRLSVLSRPQDVYDRIVTAMARAARAEIGALALYLPDERALRIVSTAGYPHAIVDHVRLQPGEGIIGRVFASGRAQLSVEAAEPPDSRRVRRRYRTESSIVLPLQSGRTVLAVISVADPIGGEHFTRIDLLALRRLIPVTILALERLMARAESERVALVASIDPVTGLANRSYLQRQLDAEIERAQRVQQPLATILLDVDDFKRVNDTRGHIEGDRLLREIAQLVTESVRIFDVCGRYGGDEFAVVMPGATEPIVQQVAERVRRAVAERFTGATGGPRITLSVGVGLLQPHDTPEQLFRRADAALLAAKAQGKNAVRFASQ
jgi:diguanylate cyclase (GGDEF)-like protein